MRLAISLVTKWASEYLGLVAEAVMEVNSSNEVGGGAMLLSHVVRSNPISEGRG